MREFSPIVAPVFAFFSRALYADAARRWRVGAFVYLLVLVVVSVVPFLIGARDGLSKLVEETGPALMDQIPRITVEEGVVHVDVGQPYTIRAPNTGEALAIIDTTGTVTSLDDTPARILITRTQVLFRKSDAETRAYDLSAIQHFEVDGVLVQGWLGLVAAWGVVLLVPLSIVGAYLFRIIQALFYSLFGMLIAKALGRRLTYGSLLNVTIVAAGPAIVIGLVVSLLDVTLPLGWLISFAISMGYLSFGITSSGENAEGDRQPTP